MGTKQFAGGKFADTMISDALPYIYTMLRRHVHAMCDRVTQMQDEFVGRVLEVRIGGRYQLRKRLGSGSFGQVYLGMFSFTFRHPALTQHAAGHDLDTGNEVAIKLEHHSIAPSFLDQEVQIYETLSGQQGFPCLFWHGYQDDFRVMVFELLGPNLEDLLRYCGNRFSLKTTLMLMDQLLSRMESLHATGHHHRDIKPENFLLGTGKQGNVLYMTDLGLAIYRQEPKSGSINRESGKSRPPSLIGTCRYASINGHLDIRESHCLDFRQQLLMRPD